MTIPPCGKHENKFKHGASFNNITLKIECHDCTIAKTLNQFSAPNINSIYIFFNKIDTYQQNKFISERHEGFLYQFVFILTQELVPHHKAALLIFINFRQLSCIKIFLQVILVSFLLENLSDLIK